MSDERIEEIRKRCELATAGPWFADCHPGGIAGSRCYRELIRSQASYPPITIAARPMRGIESGSSKQTFSDMQFIANARQDIPYLLEQIAELKAALYSIE